MKKKANSLAVLGIVLLLGLGYTIPAVVMAVEDSGLQSETKAFQIEEIELNFQNVDIVEELELFPDMILNNIVVEVGEETTGEEVEAVKQVQGEELEDMQAQAEKQESGKNQMLRSSIDAFLDVMQVEDEITFQKFYAVNYVMMAAPDDGRVYSVWKCFGVDREENEYCFWIDDNTGKVMAFEIPFSVMGVSDDSFYLAMTNIGKYYDFSSIAVGEYYTNLYKMKFWENRLQLIDETAGKELSLYIFKNGNNLCFNMYPGTISIYDSSN